MHKNALPIAKKKKKKSTPYAPFICPEHTTSSKLQCHRLPRKAGLTTHTGVRLENQAEIPSPQNSPASATLRNSKPVMYLKAFNLSPSVAGIVLIDTTVISLTLHPTNLGFQFQIPL